jgi:hypothetical protein
MKIIAVSGKMHSGKSYLTDLLIERGLGHRLAFAQPLKDDIRAMGFSQRDIDAKPPWMRKLMQVYGQAWRAVDPDHWVTRLTQQVHDQHRQEKLPTLFNMGERVFFVDDVRFENEADAMLNLKDRGIDVMLIRLMRVNYDRGDIVGSDDLSEMALDSYPDFDDIYHIQSGDLAGLVDIANDLEEWLNG